MRGFYQYPGVSPTCMQGLPGKLQQGLIISLYKLSPVSLLIVYQNADKPIIKVKNVFK